MLGWKLLKRDYNCGAELWKTQTKFLVCRKYFFEFKFFSNLKEAVDFYYKVIK
jgi:hypothetical protein